MHVDGHLKESDATTEPPESSGHPGILQVPAVSQPALTQP